MPAASTGVRIGATATASPPCATAHGAPRPRRRSGLRDSFHRRRRRLRTSTHSMRSCSRQIRSPRHRRARGPLGAEPQSSVPTLPSRRVMAHLPPIESLRDAHARTWRRLRLRPGVRSRERAGADGDRLVQRDPLSRQRRRARRQGPADRAGSAPVCFGSPVRRIDSKTFRLSRFGPAARGLRARSLGSARALPQAREWKGEHVYAVNGLSPADPNAALISVFSAGAAEIEHGVARL